MNWHQTALNSLSDLPGGGDTGPYQDPFEIPPGDLPEPEPGELPEPQPGDLPPPPLPQKEMVRPN